MIQELADYREHLERFRGVTLQALDLVEDDELHWRPGPDHYTLGQQLLHIGQAEDFQIHRLAEGEVDLGRVSFPDPIPDREGIRTFMDTVRARTLAFLEDVTAEELDAVVDSGDDAPPFTLRSWLWFILEHEIHHKGQIWVYLRQMGRTPPFFATPLPPGERPDIAMREQLGGF